MSEEIKTRKPATYVANDADREIAAFIEKAGHPVLASELVEAGIIKSPLSMIHAVNVGLIKKAGKVEKTLVKSKPMSAWIFKSEDRAMLKNGKPAEYSEIALAVIAFAKNSGKPFTLADASEALDADVKAGTLTGLVKRGNLAKAEPVDVNYDEIKEYETYILA